MSGGALERVAAALGDLARHDVPIGPLTTYRLGGSAALACEVADEAALRRLHASLQGQDVPVLVVGKGSNLLVADRGFEGLMVTLAGSFAEIEVRPDEHVVRAGGAVSLPVLARRTAAAALTGLEWAVGVPGSVGGAVRMNAGGHGSQMVETLLRCRLFDLRTSTDRVVDAANLAMGYRCSSVTTHQMVLWAEFGLQPGEKEQSEAIISDIVRWRREHQPGGRNAGSVFTNPPGDSAGRLVDAAGLRGHRVGSAQVSEKHANFIQADDGGAAIDVVRLMSEVRAGVLAASGVELHPEVRLVGFTDRELVGLR